MTSYVWRSSQLETKDEGKRRRRRRDDSRREDIRGGRKVEREEEEEEEKDNILDLVGWGRGRAERVCVLCVAEAVRRCVCVLSLDSGPAVT